MTGSTWHNLAAAAVLSLQALREYLLEPTREESRQLLEDLYGGGGGGVLGSSAATLTYSSSTLSLAADRDAVTGDGHRLFLAASDAAWTSIPFANSGATTYYVGAQAQDRPTRALAGLGGVIEYEAVIEDIGTLGAPDLVTDNGNGTLTLRISTLVSPVWSVGGTRPVVVWLVTPVTAGVEAIYEGTCSASGGHVVVTVPHLLGQDPASTTASDYRVLVRGPRITTTNITSSTSYAFLGTVTSGTWSATAQVKFPPFYALFDVEHDTGSGVHNRVRVNGADDGIEILDAGWLLVSGAGSIEVVSGNVIVDSGNVEVLGGAVYTDPGANGVPGYRYSGAATFTEDFGPRSGGWTVTSGGLTYTSGTPSSVASSSNTVAVSLRRPLVTWPSSDHSVRPTVTTVVFRYRRTGAGDAVTLALKRQLRDGTGAEATVGTSSPATTGGSWSTATLTLNHAVDAAYAYWLEITLDPDTTAADAAVADVIVSVEKTAVE